jgi:acyl-ACP thioesterase
MYLQEYPIHVYETGPDGRLTLVALFDFLQDIASAHAVKLGFGRDDLMKGNKMWVLSRIYAVVSELPAWEEKLIVCSWHKGTERLLALRDYRISTADGRPVAAATSSWLTIDLDTRKIQRPDDTLLKGSMAGPFENALPRNAVKLEAAAEGGSESERFVVRISDLDLNLHTNNVRYLKWVVDSYDLDFILQHDPCSVEINFLAESHYGDEIFIRRSGDEAESGFVNHSIFRVADSVELCRIRIGWAERNPISL